MMPGGWIGVIALGVAAAVLAPHPVRAADIDYCSDSGANVVLYLDVSTPYDPIDQRELIDGVGKVFATLTGGDRLSIRTIEDLFARSAKLLDTCIPHCEGGFFGDLFSECTEGKVIEDNKALRHRIVEGIAGRLRTSVELPHSEIIRTIALSAPEEYRTGRANTIYVFSDLIENSDFMPGREFFTREPGALIEMLVGEHLVPELWQADVKAFGIGRGGKPPERTPLTQKQLLHVEDFWTKFFAASGATVTIRQNLGGD